MSDKKIHLVFISLIALLSLLVTFTNLGLRKDFVGDDAGVNYVYYDILGKSVWNMWDETTFPGRTNTLSTIAFIFTHMLLLTYRIGFGSVLIERLLYFSFFVVSGSGFYFLFNRLAQKERLQNKFVYFAGFTSSLLYSFNYFTTVMVSFPLTNYHVSYPLLPWLLLSVIKAFDNHMSFKSIFTLVLLTLLLSSGNPSNTLSIFGFTLLFILTFKHVYKFNIKIKRSLTFLILLLAFSSYIYLPTLANGSNPYTSVGTDTNIDSLSFNSVETSFLNLFRFYGFHSAKDFPFYDLQTHNPLFIYLSFLVPILVTITFVFNKPSKAIRMFLFLALIFLFLAKGAHSPFSSWFLIPFDKVFILQMYRATYYKFIMFVVFSFSILMGFTIIELKKHANIRYLTTFLYTMPFIIIVVAWPLASGQAAKKMHLADIPSEYGKAGEFMRNNPQDFKVLSVPQLPGARLRWGDNNYYAASYYPDSVILGRPVWISSWFNNGLKKYFSNERGFEIGLGLIKFFNIKYVLVHHDIVGKNPIDIISTDGISSSLDITPGIKQVEKNKYFSIYEINNDHFLPHIYLPSTIYITDDSHLNILETGISLDANKKEVIYFTKQNEVELNKLKDFVSTFKANRKTSTEYKKVNPTKYLLNIHNATGIFPIVFSESFHPEWKMYVKSNKYNSFYETWFSSQLDDNTHFVANGYANSWILNTADLCNQPNFCTLNSNGTYDISLIIEFKPQQYFYLGLLISGASVIVAGLLCLIQDRSKGRK